MVGEGCCDEAVPFVNVTVVVGGSGAEPFEDVAAYQRQRVRDRLTSDMLAAYCRVFGIRPFDEEFYGPAGQLVENVGVTAKVRTETLQQARAWHGLE